GEKDMVRQSLAQSLQGVVAQRLLIRADNQGRVGVHEIMIVNSAIRNLITENKIAQIVSVIQISAGQGMILMEESVMRLLKQGVINKEAAESILIKMEDSIKPTVAQDTESEQAKIETPQVYTRSEFE